MTNLDRVVLVALFVAALLYGPAIVESQMAPVPSTAAIVGQALADLLSKDCGGRQWIRMRGPGEDWTTTCVDADLSRM